MKRIVAIVLAVIICVGLLAGCGSSGKSGGTVRTFPGGTTQTWGEITAYVPADMTMYSGDGYQDPENLKKATLYENTDKAKYILIQVVDSESTARSMIESDRTANSKYDPMNASFLGDTVKWKGIVFDAGEYHHLVFTATLSGKVYYVASSGYRFADGGNLPQVLNSIH